MTKICRTLIGLATATLIVLMSSASMAHGNERGSVKATINGAHISIDYGRPALKGRDMLKQIQPGQRLADRRRCSDDPRIGQGAEFRRNNCSQGQAYPAGALG